MFLRIVKNNANAIKTYINILSKSAAVTPMILYFINNFSSFHERVLFHNYLLITKGHYGA